MHFKATVDIGGTFSSGQGFSRHWEQNSVDRPGMCNTWISSKRVLSEFGYS